MENAHASIGTDAIPSFHDITGLAPYPWQIRLYQGLLEGTPPASLDIPTGVGKTSAVLLYLLALAQGAPLARRLVYVVDRRAIVDQTAVAIRQWIARIATLPDLAARFEALAAFPGDDPIGVGVLRGGLADDGAWRMDPARTTVLIGTVDMIGSRLLFSGYGDGRSRRALHAGLLGFDTFLMLDEAHLSPGMLGLVREVARLASHGERPGFRALSLSATPGAGGPGLTLDADDLAHPEVQRRIGAAKALSLHTVDDNARRLEQMADLALGFTEGAIVIFVRGVRDAARIAERLTHQLGKGEEHRVALLTGTLRGAEREALTTRSAWNAFHPGRERGTAEAACYLITTAAGEVGVDLDADHAVMDLTTLDSIIQRLGRVNRAGLGSAQVHLVLTKVEREPPKAKAGKTAKKSKKGAATPKYGERLALAVYNTGQLLEALTDCSPSALAAIPEASRLEASAPRARPVPLHATTVECLAATSTRLRTPPIALFLHGLTDEPNLPETYLAWRWDIPHLVEAGNGAAAEALSLFRPLPRELARVPTRQAEELIQAAVDRLSPLPLVVRDAAGEVTVHLLEPDADLPDLRYATVLLHPDAGGLRAGLPDAKGRTAVEDVGDDDVRLRSIVGAGAVPPEWLKTAVVLRVPLAAEDGAEDDDDEPRHLLYALRRFDPALTDADTDITRLAAAPQTLADHGARVGAAARRIAEALGLGEDLCAALETAGAAHDHGKARRIWQRAAGATLGSVPIAKSRQGRFAPRALGGYRHEFGSLADTDAALAPDAALRDLTLHLIAAHHGHARPGFADPRHWDPELPADLAEALAHQAALRFGRLQGHYGPWRLAWFEALLKCADARVSAERDL